MVTIYSSRIKNYYNSIGYECKIHDKIKVKIEHIFKTVRGKVDVKCDYCDKIQKIKYSKFLRSTKHNTCKYACCNSCGGLKSKEFLNQNFNVINVSQLESVKNKKIIKSQQAYGVNNVSQSKIIQNKVKRTKKKRYDDENYVNIKKIKETKLKRYGDQNYGAFGSIYYNKKIKEKYGDINPSNTPEARQKSKNTSIKNYGVEYPSQSKIIKDKTAKTNIERYGVVAPLQNSEIFSKNQKNAFKLKLHKETGLYYRGTYEKHFLDYCFIQNIDVAPGLPMSYFYKDKMKVYHSDFYLKQYNLIIEIKSKYYYEKYLERNLAKQKACIKQGYDFIFIIDKNYECFENILNKVSNLP